MTPIISIPVTPLIMSLFNDCKTNMKYQGKSDADFLIFLLNSSMHIYSIVKEFAPLISLGGGDKQTSDPVEDSPDKQSSTPTLRTAAEQLLADIMTSEEEDGGEMNGEEHFLKYKPPVKSPGSGFRCSKCLSKFVSKGTLKRHKTICLAPEINHNTSSSGEDSGADNTPSEYSNFLPLKCHDCKKRFATAGNLNRHMKLSRRCGKGEISDGESCEREVRKLLSTSLPAYLPTQQQQAGDDESPTPPQISCTFCGSEFASEKTYNVHIRKYRCKRRCKICDFTSGQSVFVHNHMVKEHGLTDSVDDIESYNKSLFLEHFNLKNIGSTVPDGDLPSEYHCTVYECVFSTLHKGGLNTHIRYHTAQIAANSQAYRSCEKCGKIGIPLEVFGAHQCGDDAGKNNNNENSSAVENVTSSSPPAVTSPSATEKEKASTPIKIGSAKLTLSLKRKSISSSVVKLSRPISSSRPSIPPSKAAQMQSIRLDLGDGKVKYKCKHCDFIAESNQSIAGHMNTHRAKKPKLQL